MIENTEFINQFENLKYFIHYLCDLLTALVIYKSNYYFYQKCVFGFFCSRNLVE